MKIGIFICDIYFVVWISSVHFVLVIFHWACCLYRWFYIFAVLTTSVHMGILCTATWKWRGEYWKCIRVFFFLNLFVIHDIFIMYFFVIRILFCVIERISVYLLFNWVLYLYFCSLCFVFKLCVWYWKVQTWYLLLCWLRLYTNLCNWVAIGVLILFVYLSRRVILFCDICVTKFPFPLFRRRICRSKVILGILKNGVLGVLPKFCTFQKLDYLVLSQVYILRLVFFQWVLALTFIYFVVKFGVCYLVLLYILIFIFVLTFYLLFWYFIICIDFCLYYDICYFVLTYCCVLYCYFVLTYCCVLYYYFCFDLLFLFEFFFFEPVFLLYWNIILCSEPVFLL